MFYFDTQRVEQGASRRVYRGRNRDGDDDDDDNVKL